MPDFDKVPCPIVTTDREGMVHSVNESLLAVVGGETESWLSKPIHSMLPTPSRIFMQTHVWPILLREQQVAELRIDLLSKDGASVPTFLNCRVTEQGGVEFLTWVFFVSNDRSRFEKRLVESRQRSEAIAAQLKKSESELRKSHEELRVTLMSIGDAVITTNPLGEVEWMNPVAERLTGWSATEAQKLPLTKVFRIVNEDTRLPTENPVATCLEQGKIVGLANHTVLISRTGDEYGIEDSAAPIRNEAGDVLGVVLVFHDVTEQRRLSGEMSYRASHDKLTGLVNRAEFENRLNSLLKNVIEENSQHALMFIDLDQFKLVNDTSGHSVGDRLLRQVSQVLLDAVRGSDTVARLGGDEFGILLPHCAIEAAQGVAQKICDHMAAYRFQNDGHRFRIGASIGLVPIGEKLRTSEAIMQAADTSCYAAKEAGRNRVHTWFDSDHAIRTRHGEVLWTNRIERALDENRFELFAQKIEPLASDDDGLRLEVLLRMVDPEGALISPGAFLPAAERYNLVTRIDRWVLRNAVEALASLPNLSLLNTMSINLSGQSIGDLRFHRDARELLASVGSEFRKCLCLEITETETITNLADAQPFIDEVRSMGVRIALDDFGAGASSFGYLKNLRVDYLKIDGQFIQNLMSDPLCDVTVRCFIDVARVLGVKTVAEFVDKDEVLERVTQMGVDFGQGYLLHKPESLTELLRINS